MDTLITAFFIAMVVNQIVDGLAEPVRKKKPELDLWWLVYVTWVFGGVIAYLAQINLFSTFVPTLAPVVGKVLTAVITGGGARLLHAVFSKSPVTTISASSSGPSTMMATVQSDPKKEE